jgi:hypothetical protein
MRYAVARLNERERAAAYRIYVTDILQGLSGAQNRYADIVYPHSETQKEEEKPVDPEEIIQGIMSRTGIKEKTANKEVR